MRRPAHKFVVVKFRVLVPECGIFSCFVPANFPFVCQRPSKLPTVKYRFDEKTIKTDDPRVVKEEDHTCDTLKYFAIDNAQLLGLLV
jgi:hypothetical protein